MHLEDSDGQYWWSTVERIKQLFISFKILVPRLSIHAFLIFFNFQIAEILFYPSQFSEDQLKSLMRQKKVPQLTVCPNNEQPDVEEVEETEIELTR